MADTIPPLPGKGAEFKKIGLEKDLDDEDLAELATVVKGFRVAITNLNLYPHENPQVKASVEAVYVTLNKALEKYKFLVFSDVEGELLVNKQRPHFKAGERAPGGLFLENLKTSQIKSVTFRAGLSLEELFIFLEGLSRKRQLEGAGDTFRNIFERDGVRHIGLNERVYVAVGESDLLIERGAELLDKSGGKLAELMKSLDEVAELSGADDTVQKDRAKVEIAKRMMETDPGSLIKFLEKPSKETVEEVKQDAVQTLPADKVKEIVAEIANTCRSILPRAKEGSPEEQELSRLKKLLHSFLSICKDRSISLDMYRDLLERDLSDLLPSWWNLQAQLPEEQSLPVKASLLLRQEPLALLSSPVVDDLPQMIEELYTVGSGELSTQLVRQVALNLNAQTSEIRGQSLSLIKKLIDVLTPVGQKPLISELYKKIKEAGEVEKSETVFGIMSGLLKSGVESALLDGDYEFVRDIIDLFWRHRKMKGSGADKKAKIAEEILQQLGKSDFVKVLLADIKSEERERRDQGYSALLKLGDEGVAQIIDMIKQTEDLRWRKVLVSIIMNIGAGAIVRLSAAVSADIPAEHILRFIPLLPGIVSEEIALEKLSLCLLHPDPRVRKEVLRTAGKLSSNSVIDISEKALEDEEATVVIEAIRVLGEKGTYYNAEKLLRFFGKTKFSSAEEDAIEEECCRAIGKIGERMKKEGLADEKSKFIQESLTEILADASSTGGFFKSKNRTVRVAAIKALTFFDSPLAKETLQKAIKDKDPYVQRTAAEALAAIQKMAN